MKEYNVTVHKPWTKDEIDGGVNTDAPKKISYKRKYTISQLLEQLSAERNSVTAMDYDEIIIDEVSDSGDRYDISLRKGNNHIAHIVADTSDQQQSGEGDNNQDNDSNQSQGGKASQPADQKTTSHAGGRDGTAPTSTQYTKGEGGDNSNQGAAQKKTIRNDRPDSQASDAKSSSARS